MDHKAQDVLTAGLATLRVPADPNAKEKLIRFADEIALWNPHLGLVAADGETLVVRHFLDCLAGLEVIRNLEPRRLADIGSGAGFPGIPLALFLPDADISLVERSGKRAGYLRNVVLTLGLRHVTVVEAPMEDLDRRHDVLTFRAFRPIDADLIRELSRLLDSDGKIVAYKGKRHRLTEELDAASKEISGYEIIPVSVPGLDEERNLAVISLNPRR